MLLTHNRDICQTDLSVLYDDEYFKETVKNISPLTIYAENSNFLDSLSTTIVNYSPISINIIDYWNKDVYDNAVFIPKRDVDTLLEIVPAFEFQDETPDIIEEDEGLGFFDSRNGGSLINDLRVKHFNPNASELLCPNDTKERFYINSLIGVQDKLAYTNINSFYDITTKASHNTVIFNKIDRINYILGKDEKIFDNVNILFSEDRTLGNKNYITKKGTTSAVKYAGQSANDAKIQGPNTIYGNYFMNIVEEGPFRYSVESNLLSVVFETFIKPLSHPIGMIVDYKTTCTDVIANRTETPVIHKEYKDRTLMVNCLCFAEDENDPMYPQTDPITCLYNTHEESYPKSKIFATPTGLGLWEPIKRDNNILHSFEEGYIPSSNESYEKWNMTNKNYLIVYTKKPQQHTDSEKVRIQYWVWLPSNNKYTLSAQFFNNRHCNGGLDKEPKLISSIIENIIPSCNQTLNGVFSFRTQNEDSNNLPPDTPGDDGYYSGFMGTNYGGVLLQYSDLYFGDFQLLEKSDSIDVTYGADGFLHGFSQSKLVRYEPVDGPIPVP
jgi:hypothetical protein